MIEIIGTGNKNEKELKWRSLPKNVRQIGETQERQKIYMEDYVVTYLGRLAKPDQAYARGAILFGQVFETEEGAAIFINGAVEAQNLELDMDETVFNHEIWKELCERGKRYFPEQEIMGWFLSRMGFSVEMNQKIINTHMRNFPGEQTVLYMIDALEKEDAMYLCENGQMKRQKGYYIYYEKNTSMQEYMMESREREQKTTEENRKTGELRRDRKVVNSYRKLSRYSKADKKQNFKIRTAKAACLMLILIMGVYIAGRFSERIMEKKWSEYAVETFRGIKNILPADTEKNKVIQETMTGDETIVVTEEENRDEESEGTTGTEGAEETAAQPKPLYYIVKKGDTLAEISRKMYSTDKYTKQIAQANDLQNANEIYEGQKILIPSIE